MGSRFVLISWFIGSALYAETWEQQAERLQNVSAAMLDDVPFAEILSGSSHVLFKSSLSILPKTNPTIGAKSESVPSSPIHMVPTVQADFIHQPQQSWSTGLRAWAGYLPSGTEKLVGLNASMSQWKLGASWINRFTLGELEPGFELGLQKTAAKLSGAITASDANDEFKVSTQLVYGAIALRIPKWQTWTSLIFLRRTAESEFYIPADSTRLSLTDTMDDGGSPISEQIAAGYEFANGWQVGLGQLYVPDRLTMTRLLAGWKVAL